MVGAGEAGSKAAGVGQSTKKTSKGTNRSAKKSGAETLKRLRSRFAFDLQYITLQRHVVNSKTRRQRDVVRLAELNPHCLPGERTGVGAVKSY